jgi:RNA polymerase sigma-70 factor (ECF subfamily)
MTSAPTDAELVERALRGATQAFHQLCERYYRPVGGFIFKRVGQYDLVEDLVQETFLEAFQAIKAGQKPTHFSSWLFGIAHNRCGKWLRRKRPALFDPNDAPDLATADDPSLLEEVEEQEKQLAWLDTQIRCLPLDIRRILELKHRDGKTCEQIAVDMGRPVGTIKSLLARTYKALRETIGASLVR